MNHEHRDEPGPRALFERAVQGLDAGTANRLRLMRREALAARPAGSLRLVPAAAFGAAVLALGLGWHLAQRPVAEPAADEATLATDLAADEETALYAWLGDAPVAEDRKL